MFRNLFVAILLFIGCETEKPPALDGYSDVVGNIVFNNKTDGDFKRCDPYTNQYYGTNKGFGYHGEMFKIKKEIFGAYKPINQNNQSGFITIRFVVNCNGKAGMHRVYTTDLSLNQFSFDQKIVNQFLTATKNLNDWKIAEYEGIKYDYYQYLTFKIIDGNLIEIAP